MANSVDVGFDPYVGEVFGQFFDSQAYIQYIRGPAGTGKTYGICWKLLSWALQQEKAQDGNRYYRVLVVRNTANMLKSATFSTFNTALQELMKPPIAKVTMSPYIDVAIKLKMPDEVHKNSVLNLEIKFRAFDDEASVANALGFEYSSVFIDEVTETQLEVFSSIIMRVGRYRPPAGGGPTKYGVLCAANGSLRGHFMEDWAKGANRDVMEAIAKHISHPIMFEAFQQPPGLIPPDYDWEVLPMAPDDWRPNPKAENVENLPDGYGYYYKQLVNSPSKIYMYVLGLPAPKVAGKLVFPGFNMARHVTKGSTVDRRLLKHIMLSFDYGLTPCCLIGITTSKGRLLIIDEVVTERESIDGLLRDHLIPLLKERYNNPTYSFGTGDPTGEILRDTGEKSPVDVLREYGIEYTPPPCGNNLNQRLEGVRQALAKGNQVDGWDLQIADSCPVLIESLSEYYVYPSTKTGMVRDVPMKGHPHSDVADCLQYMVSCFYTMRSEAEERRKRLQASFRRGYTPKKKYNYLR